MEKVLVIATHPDDETLGAGGFMLKMLSEGHQVYVLNMTNVSEEAGYTLDIIERRNAEISKLIKMYPINGYYNLGLKPAQLDTYAYNELIGKVNKVFNEIKPEIVILPYKYDIHSDHRITFDVCYSCTKSFRYPFIKKILMMETPSETDFALSKEAFSPNYFVNISNCLERKIEIASIFESEILNHPFPRSERNIRAYSTIRGASAFMESAEAFEIIRIMDK